jgi:hypothetical protein
MSIQPKDKVRVTTPGHFQGQEAYVIEYRGQSKNLTNPYKPEPCSMWFVYPDYELIRIN